MHTVPMSPGYDLLNVSGALAALLIRTYLGIRHFPSRDLVSRKGCRHPCRQAAFFLPCARPPDVLRLRFGRPRNHRGAYLRRAFVLTRSGFHTMPSGRGDRGDADDVSVAASRASSSRLRDPPEAPDDLKAALTDPADDEFGTKIFMTLEFKDFEPSPVTDAGQLLTLRSDFLNNLGPQFVWIIMFSPLEWTTLTTAEKKLHTVLRKSFVTSYAYGSEHILQHWLWKTLKKATKSFGPLLKVFAKDYGTAASSGTDAWVSIFTLYPLAGAVITHKLLVSGLERCMSIPDDSMPAFTKYIAHIN
jgi:hypothetical protein